MKLKPYSFTSYTLALIVGTLALFFTTFQHNHMENADIWTHEIIGFKVGLALTHVERTRDHAVIPQSGVIDIFWVPQTKDD